MATCRLTEDSRLKKFRQILTFSPITLAYQDLRFLISFSTPAPNSNLNVLWNRLLTMFLPKELLLLCFMKLRRGFTLSDLAFRFKISRKTAKNIFITWLHLLHEIFFQGHSAAQWNPKRWKERPLPAGVFLIFCQHPHCARLHRDSCVQYSFHGGEERNMFPLQAPPYSKGAYRGFPEWHGHFLKWPITCIYEW